MQTDARPPCPHCLSVSGARTPFLVRQLAERPHRHVEVVLVAAAPALVGVVVAGLRYALLCVVVCDCVDCVDCVVGCCVLVGGLGVGRFSQAALGAAPSRPPHPPLSPSPFPAPPHNHHIPSNPISTHVGARAGVRRAHDDGAAAARPTPVEVLAVAVGHGARVAAHLVAAAGVVVVGLGWVGFDVCCVVFVALVVCLCWVEVCVCVLFSEAGDGGGGGGVVAPSPAPSIALTRSCRHTRGARRTARRRPSPSTGRATCSPCRRS